MSSDRFAPRRPPSSNERKYRTRNPVVRRLLERFLERVAGHVRRLAPARIVDLGAGEGEVAARLAALGLAAEYLGIDRSADAVADARGRLPHLRFAVGDVTFPPQADGWADVALCLEVLEHLADPAPAVGALARWTRDAAVVSVPWEPFFRLGNLARGRHLARLGNHPEHLQAFTPASLRRLLAASFAEVRVETCFPWILAVARHGRRRA